MSRRHSDLPVDDKGRGATGRRELGFTAPYKLYALLTLAVAYAFIQVDRGLIILLLQPIKLDLHLSDTELGFLTGIAFGLFYATLGVPIARWADRSNRVAIVSASLALWGATVMSCLYVTSFAQLACARIAAGIGESGCLPPSYSLVGDYFPGAAERPRAMAIFWLGSPVSLLVSFLLGGWLDVRYGWRMTFFLMGIPALLAAVLIRATLTEPRALQSGATSERRLPRTIEALTALWMQRSSRHLGLAVILLYTTALGLAPWYAAFIMRSHAMGTAETAVWLGGIFGVGGIAGTLLGGFVTHQPIMRHERRQMRVIALLMTSLVPCFALFLLLPQKHQALLALAVLIVAFNFFFGPTFALMQRLVADEIRATTLALVMLLANLIGMGIGPQIVGILSDLMATTLGDDSLRYAMLCMSSVALWSAYHFWQVGSSVEEDLRLGALAASSGG